MNEANMIHESPPDFPGSLLRVARWLDSQDADYEIYLRGSITLNLCYPFVNHPAWEQTMNYSIGESRYYHPNTRNKERVLAVLMLREAILSGDL